jgi:cytochrome c peroxidase
MGLRKLLFLSTAFVGLSATFVGSGSDHSPNLRPQPNPHGAAQTFSSAGYINLGSKFFKNLGTNERTCGTCHQEGDGWTVTPEHIQARFQSTQGTDPIFRTNDGSVCSTADVSTVEARRNAYSMLLSKGLIRVQIGVPENAEFVVDNIDDPYVCATPDALSLFRRPLPATNLRFLTTVMWDGRESPKGRSLHDSLISQAISATTGHAQGALPTGKDLEDMVAFEMGLTTAQFWDTSLGALNSNGANGGALPLTKQQFYVGVNDPLGGNPTGAAFDPTVFRIYSSWANEHYKGASGEMREAVARGETIFNTHPVPITGVAGLNDELKMPVINGTCTTCHDSPNVGNHSVPLPINIGLVDENRRTPDMPLYTLRCVATGEIFKVTDPGRALISGKCKDIGKFKGPILRGLAARAPYFHNGSAATLRDAVDFYDTRFNLNLTEQEKSDLVAFLETL